MQTTAEFIACTLLNCGSSDIETLFGKFTDNEYFFNAVCKLKDCEVELTAESIWTECIDEAFSDVFGDDVEYDIIFNFIASHVSVSRDTAYKTRGFAKKAKYFAELSDFHIEIDGQEEDND